MDCNATVLITYFETNILIYIFYIVLSCRIIVVVMFGLFRFVMETAKIYFGYNEVLWNDTNIILLYNDST